MRYPRRKDVGNPQRQWRETSPSPDDSLDEPGRDRTHNRLMTRDSSSAARRRDRITGSLFLTSGILFVLGVLNPAVIGSWGDSPGQALASASGHKAAWYASTWLITLSVVAGIMAVTMLAR